METSYQFLTLNKYNYQKCEFDSMQIIKQHNIYIYYKKEKSEQVIKSSSNNKTVAAIKQKEKEVNKVIINDNKIMHEPCPSRDRKQSISGWFSSLRRPPKNKTSNSSNNLQYGSSSSQNITTSAKSASVWDLRNDPTNNRHYIYSKVNLQFVIRFCDTYLDPIFE